MDGERARRRFERFERATDLPLALLALLIVPALILEAESSRTAVRELAVAVNWIVWVAFCVEYGGKLWLAPDRRVQVRRAWFDLLLIVLSPPFLVPEAVQGVRTLRAARLVRLLRIVRAVAVAGIGLREASDAFRRRQFHYVALVTSVVVSLGAVAIFAVERGTNPAIASMGDAFWWSIVTTTTVGYGDVSPRTPEGRLIAVGLMILGIGFIGVFTATLTSFFVDPSGRGPRDSTEARLERIEKKLDALMTERGARR